MELTDKVSEYFISNSDTFPATIFGSAAVLSFFEGSVASTVLLNFSSPCVEKEEAESFLTEVIAADSNNTLGIALRAVYEVCSDEYCSSESSCIVVDSDRECREDNTSNNSSPNDTHLYGRNYRTDNRKDNNTNYNCDYSEINTTNYSKEHNTINSTTYNRGHNRENNASRHKPYDDASNITNNNSPNDDTSNNSQNDDASNNSPNDDASNNSPNDDASNNSPNDDASNNSPNDDASNNSPNYDASNNSPNDDASNNSPNDDASNNSPNDDASNNSPNDDASNNSPNDDASNNSTNDDASNNSPNYDTSNNSPNDDASNNSTNDDASNNSPNDDASNNSPNDDASNNSPNDDASNNTNNNSPNDDASNNTSYHRDDNASNNSSPNDTHLYGRNYSTDNRKDNNTNYNCDYSEINATKYSKKHNTINSKTYNRGHNRDNSACYDNGADQCSTIDHQRLNDYSQANNTFGINTDRPKRNQLDHQRLNNYTQADNTFAIDSRWPKYNCHKNDIFYCEAKFFFDCHDRRDKVDHQQLEYFSTVDNTCRIDTERPKRNQLDHQQFSNNKAADNTCRIDDCRSKHDCPKNGTFYYNYDSKCFKRGCQHFGKCQHCWPVYGSFVDCHNRRNQLDNQQRYNNIPADNTGGIDTCNSKYDRKNDRDSYFQAKYRTKHLDVYSRRDNCACSDNGADYHRRIVYTSIYNDYNNKAADNTCRIDDCRSKYDCPKNGTFYCEAKRNHLDHQQFSNNKAANNTCRIDDYRSKHDCPKNGTFYCEAKRNHLDSQQRKKIIPADNTGRIDTCNSKYYRKNDRPSYFEAKYRAKHVDVYSRRDNFACNDDANNTYGIDIGREKSNLPKNHISHSPCNNRAKHCIVNCWSFYNCQNRRNHLDHQQFSNNKTADNTCRIDDCRSKHDCPKNGTFYCEAKSFYNCHNRRNQLHHKHFSNNKTADNTCRIDDCRSKYDCPKNGTFYCEAKRNHLDYKYFQNFSPANNTYGIDIGRQKSNVAKNHISHRSCNNRAKHCIINCWLFHNRRRNIDHQQFENNTPVDNTCRIHTGGPKYDRSYNHIFYGEAKRNHVDHQQLENFSPADNNRRIDDCWEKYRRLKDQHWNWSFHYCSNVYTSIDNDECQHIGQHSGRSFNCLRINRSFNKFHNGSSQIDHQQKFSPTNNTFGNDIGKPKYDCTKNQISNSAGKYRANHSDVFCSRDNFACRYNGADNYSRIVYANNCNAEYNRLTSQHFRDNCASYEHNRTVYTNIHNNEYNKRLFFGKFFNLRDCQYYACIKHRSHSNHTSNDDCDNNSTGYHWHEHCFPEASNYECRNVFHVYFKDYRTLFHWYNIWNQIDHQQCKKFSPTNNTFGNDIDWPEYDCPKNPIFNSSGNYRGNHFDVFSSRDNFGYYCIGADKHSRILYANIYNDEYNKLISQHFRKRNQLDHQELKNYNSFDNTHRIDIGRAKYERAKNNICYVEGKYRAKHFNCYCSRDNFACYDNGADKQCTIVYTNTYNDECNKPLFHHFGRFFNRQTVYKTIRHYHNKRNQLDHQQFGNFSSSYIRIYNGRPKYDRPKNQIYYIKCKYRAKHFDVYG
ncbi:TGOLN2 [Branchiostoma lanceolatum]|uniref:TGOLN2 protein n=1 Tax=Branchiostoma lanceolatum TaxID=7740 RepID=A0A8J9VHR6_BRALA|nr:TGOLN2 [Branchiostoma lanceolatum]